MIHGACGNELEISRRLERRKTKTGKSPVCFEKSPTIKHCLFCNRGVILRWFFFLKMIRCCLCIWLNKKIRKDDDLSSTIGNKKCPLMQMFLQVHHPTFHQVSSPALVVIYVFSGLVYCGLAFMRKCVDAVWFPASQNVKPSCCIQSDSAERGRLFQYTERKKGLYLYRIFV